MTDRPALTEEALFEHRNDLCDVLASDGQNVWQRLESDRTSFAKQYLGGKAAIETSFRWKPGENAGVDFGYGLAVFYRDREGLISGNDWWPNPFEIAVPIDPDAEPHFRRGVRGPYRNKQSVLVHDVETIKRPEDFISGLPVASLVWLQLFDGIDSFVAHTRLAGPTLPIEGLKVVADWEVCSIVRGVAIAQDEGPSEMVKGRSQIVEDISDDRGELFGYLLSNADFEEYLSGLRLLVDFKEVRLSGTPSRDLRIEMLDVVLRPVEFYSCASQTFYISVCRHV